MRIHFVGADLEENLGLGILAAVAERAGHRARIVAFNDISEIDDAVKRAMLRDPDVIGLSIQFQHRAPEFLKLARKLREAGYRGHLTCGGQFPTLAWRETLEGQNGVDSIVLHDGEETLPEVLSALDAGSSLAEIPGLALMGPGGVAFRTSSRRLLDDLDAVPFAKRYRGHNEHMSVPFIPIIAGRGCWGKCNYCSIIAFYDDAIDSGGGRAVRLRSPANVAAEMALLLENAGGRGIFCFHDDNFLFPRESYSLKRIREIREALDGYDVGKVAMIGKARPDCVTPALAKELAALGVIRLYIGVENGSQEGGDHLRRGMQQDHVRGALKACREAGIFVCYNLLVFEPKGSVDAVRENVRFIRDHADHPVNFCRAEPYFGTALHLDMVKEQHLGGSYLGYDYRIDDDRAELVYRIAAAAFRERNFAPAGVANRYMGLGYAANVLTRFFDVGGNSQTIQKARELTRKISLCTAAYLEKVIALGERVAMDDFDTIERETALLGLEVAAADQHWHRELDELYDDMRAFAKSGPVAAQDRPLSPSPRFTRLKASVAIGLSLAAAAAGPGCSDDDPTGTSSASGSVSGSGEGGMVVDPAPGGMGGMGGDEVGGGGTGGQGGKGGGGEGGMVVDPAPGGMGGMGGVGLLDDDDGVQEAGEQVEKHRLRLVDQWFDTSPKAAQRSVDLPLSSPPMPSLVGERDGDDFKVSLRGVRPEAVTTRWEADGDIIGKGTEITWRPRSESERLRVAVRSRGGVAVLTLRAKEVPVVT